MKWIRITSKFDYHTKSSLGEVSCVVKRDKEKNIIAALDLRGSHRVKVSGRIGETPVKGAIAVEDSRVFLCQNSCDGAECPDKLGYSFSWIIQGKYIHVTAGNVELDPTSKWRLAFTF